MIRVPLLLLPVFGSQVSFTDNFLPCCCLRCIYLLQCHYHEPPHGPPHGLTKQIVDSLSWHRSTWILMHRRSTVVLSASQTTNNLIIVVVCTGIWYGCGHMCFLSFVPVSVQMVDYEHQLKASYHYQIFPFSC